MSSAMTKIEDGTLLIREGEKPDVLYKVIKGKIAMYSGYGSKEEYLFGIISEGRYIGLDTFFTGDAGKYTYAAVSDCLVLRVDHDNFEDFIRSNVSNAMDIMKTLAKDNALLNSHIDMMGEELMGRINATKAEKIDLQSKLLESRYKWMKL